MAHTVVGVFDTSNEAQTALQQLVGSGISRDFIDIAPQMGSDLDKDKDNDSIGSFFRNLFGSDDRTDRYSSYARNGAIVTVHARSAEEAERAADIMDDNGAVNLDERTSGYAAGAAATGTTTPDSTRTDSTTTGTTIPVIEEDMHVGKRTVETGGVRVRSRILERPVEEHLRLREEHVHIERNPVNRPATDKDLNTFKEGEIKMTEHAEVPVVDKEARVVEEIRIGKEVEEHEEQIHGTVRKTDVEVDKLSEEDLRRNRLNNDPSRHV
ncbi:YsnF/AvaK domain-containing protein [Pontibacter beigongshangensis]|uniref:YsnF/AvaK domain-containing protein n=1 Tax=Pontibacter beigongshangensis TaxID=2574733 RepID=UPI00164F123F|nr:YsnF/AvaK domain-containing protein [Pontibacter beigongshangensis]